MKIVIFTVNHVYANKLVKDILQRYKSNVRLIIEPKILLKNKNFAQTMIHYLNTSGFKYLYYQSLKMLLYKVLSKFEKRTYGKFYNFEKIVYKYKTKILRVMDINSNTTITKIKAIHPDIIISVLFPQIIKNDILNLFKNRIINFHPAYLPNYRGISPIFWSLLNKEKYAGYTIHYIDKDIDSGAILFQKKIKIIKSDTEDSLYMRCVNEGSKDLMRMIGNFSKKTKPKGIIKKGGSYYSFPDKKSVKKFLSTGCKFFRLKEFIWN